MDGPRAAGRTRRTTGGSASSAPLRGVRRRGRTGDGPADGPSIGWSRRIGVALALVGLGGTIVLAGSGALDSGARRVDPTIPAVAPPSGAGPTGSPLPTLGPPVIQGSSAVLTRERTWVLIVSLPRPVLGRRDASLLVYRGDRVVAQRGVRARERMRIGKVPLKRGANHLTVAIAGPGGSSPRSAEVIVTRDDLAPRLRILGPAEGRVINATSATITGTSEPGATLTVRNESTTDSSEALIGSSGTFDVVIDLQRGFNRIEVRAEDAAGNTASDTIFLTRGEGQPFAQLTMSATFFRIERLPATVSIQVAVLDADGAPVDAAPVTFSLSPPGLPASTYRTTTSDGAASWTNVSLPAEGATPGQGLVTVQVTLDDGTTVRESLPFRFR